MEIIEYFSSENREHWLYEIEKSDWGAGKFLFKLLKEEKLKETVGKTPKFFYSQTAKSLFPSVPLRILTISSPPNLPLGLGLFTPF